MKSENIEYFKSETNNSLAVSVLLTDKARRSDALLFPKE